MMLFVKTLFYIRELPTYSWFISQSKKIVTLLFPLFTRKLVRLQRQSVASSSQQTSSDLLFSFSSIPARPFSSKERNIVILKRRQSLQRRCLLVASRSGLVAIIRVFCVKKAHPKRVGENV